MGFYENHVLPRLINAACSQRPIMKQREKVVPLAEGRILEIGMGSGLNLDFYDREKVEKLWGLEPSEAMRKRATAAAEKAGMEIELIDLPGEEIPLENNTVDTVLLTYTLCTIPEWEPALRQMARVLKPGGKLIFCEHGEAPDEAVQKWQKRINPYWKIIGGGCNMNRPIPKLIEQSGFTINTIDTMYLPGWKPASFNYWGIATEA